MAEHDKLTFFYYDKTDQLYQGQQPPLLQMTQDKETETTESPFKFSFVCFSLVWHNWNTTGKGLPSFFYYNHNIRGLYLGKYKQTSKGHKILMNL